MIVSKSCVFHCSTMSNEEYYILSQLHYVQNCLCEKKTVFKNENKQYTQPTITCSKLTIGTLEQRVKYVQS